MYVQNDKKIQVEVLCKTARNCQENTAQENKKGGEISGYSQNCDPTSMWILQTNKQAMREASCEAGHISCQSQCLQGSTKDQLNVCSYRALSRRRGHLLKEHSHLHMHICMQTYLHIRIHTGMQIYVHVHIYTGTQTYTQRHIHNRHANMHVYAHTHYLLDIATGSQLHCHPSWELHDKIVTPAGAIQKRQKLHFSRTGHEDRVEPGWDAS